MTATKSNEDQLMNIAAEIKNTYQPAEIAQLVRLISPTPSTGEMSPEEFERLMKELEAQSNRRGYSEKSIEAARLVLVMGAGITEAAADMNLTRQTVNQLMVRIRRRMESLPQGWVKVTDWLPDDVAKQVAKISEELRSLHAAGKLAGNQQYTINFTAPASGKAKKDSTQVAAPKLKKQKTVSTPVAAPKQSKPKQSKSELALSQQLAASINTRMPKEESWTLTAWQYKALKAINAGDGGKNCIEGIPARSVSGLLDRKLIACERDVYRVTAAGNRILSRHEESTKRK